MKHLIYCFGRIPYQKMIKLVVIGIIISLGIAGCQAAYLVPSADLMNWKFTDLRLLDPVDTSDPEQDLLALYSRKLDDSFQIRLDFLDLGTQLNQDIYIPIDTHPNGTVLRADSYGHLGILTRLNWDYLLKIAASGEVSLLDSRLSQLESQEIFIIWDSMQDRVIIDFVHNQLPIYDGLSRVQAVVAAPGGNLVLDQTSPVFVDDALPTARTKIMFVFWNSYSSLNPAQALRSWAGAHSGPMSSRHGLLYLIDEASQSNSTLFIYDLFTPGNISALEYSGSLSQINRLVRENTIINIDNTNGKSIFIFSRLNNNILFGDNDYAHYINLQSDCNLTPNYKGDEVSVGSLSLACKKLLINQAITYPSDPLVLGGDFSTSPFGDPATAQQVFGYIASHPWLQTATINDLSTEKRTLEALNSLSTAINSGNNPGNITETLVQRQVSIALRQAPANQLSILAQSIYSELTKPAEHRLASLRSAYIGQLGLLLKGAEWAEAPTAIQTCSIDLDYDGENECILSTDSVYAVIEPQGGYIPVLFSKDAQGVHQIIGPTWEFSVGLSDPSKWNPGLGLQGDPAQLLGAFQDQYTDWQTYSPEITHDEILLRDKAGSIAKSFSIAGDRIQIHLQNVPQSQKVPVPLAVDPWIRFTPDWGQKYSGKIAGNSYIWGLDPGIMVKVTSTGKIDAYAFNDTLSMMSRPEDPNYDYSSGHYLPFPMAVVDIYPSNESYITIETLP